MRLTNAERLLLVMLADIHEAMQIKGSIDHRLLKRALASDNIWAVQWANSDIFSNADWDPTPPEVTFVGNVLDMWTALEEAHDRFDDEAKEKVKAGARSPGDKPMFGGFDGETESGHLSIARFLIHDMDRHRRFKDRELNSHTPTVAAQARMWEEFEVMRSELSTQPMTPQQMISILSAGGGEA